MTAPSTGIQDMPVSSSSMGIGIRFAAHSYMWQAGDGTYEVIHYPECGFGECIEPKSEDRLEFETLEEARLYAASKGYLWGDPFAPYA